MQRTQFLKIKNNNLELEKDFMQLRKQKQSKEKREKVHYTQKATIQNL